ncbi:cation-translocating P-type ATPase [Pusillibacter faecalis]|uniref:Cation-transporting ATPase, P-type n=1 Tax=Pusillibacter faecalis TaxID=2714358 RepID=A0A810QJK2_9FIRM|nr:cation-translocating P-type ATPase [Pusillibacter faecalis]MCQ5027105.1 cation-translocating P-type ATPase [Oscillibacter valericigenes]BCK84593.1 cation-transporting ATPase, P-type [Pusillibacter faecalis]
MNQERPIWQRTRAELLRDLDCSEDGLSSQEAAARLEQHGPNELQSGKQKSIPRIFAEQFADFLVIILILAAIVSAILGDVESTVVILAVITMNAILGTVQTVKASASLDSLKRMSAPTAKVLRDGKVLQIPGREVTVGDVVSLEAGDSVCADGRLLECASLKCAESALTGESLPVEKDLSEIAGDVPLGDRRNMVFSGSFVTYGRAKFLVTAIGMDTEMGKIASLLKNTEEKKTPLQVSLDQFGKKLSIGILVICAVLFCVSVFLRQENLMNAFLFAVALAVAAIPEALSSIVTIVLSFGTQKMARENAIIRKLQAVEGLGSVSVICSDKTGTLTQNKMTVKKLYTGGKIVDASEADFHDPVQEPLLRTALLCSDATVDENGEVGDPTETALVRLGEDYGFDELTTRGKWPRLTEIPFDSDRKLMSTVHQLSGGLVMVTKGAVDVLLDRCIISAEERAEIERVNEEFSSQGLRVLAFACRTVDRAAVSLEDENDLNFLGLIAMMDPPREESKAAVAECIAAGIRPIMITGDHKVTASAIAREIGILTPGTEAVEGGVIESMSDEELREFVPKVSVYARVSPEHKIRIVRAWQDRGCLVAMTGDGVNDAPALKQADIGVAMGITGTEVAKDAAGMVLTDDNFATIVQAVKNGRNVYANIKKAIQFLLSGNTAAILTVLYASLAALPVPFAAVHLLFINLLTDSLPAIALGLEPHSDTVMREKPRPRNEGILTKSFLASVATEGLVIALAVIAAFHIGLASGGAATGSTMAFATLCLSRLFHGFNCKADRPVVFTRAFWNNRYLLGAFVVGALLLSAVLLIPALEPLFQVAQLSAGLVGAIVGLSLGSMAVIQLLKALRPRK